MLNYAQIKISFNYIKYFSSFRTIKLSLLNVFYEVMIGYFNAFVELSIQITTLLLADF